MIVLENVLNAQELAAIIGFLKTANFVDGKATAVEAVRDRKENQQIQRGTAEAAPMDRVVVQALSRHPVLQAWAQPLRMSAPTFNRYGPGMFYGNHVDFAVTGVNQPMRADVSLTLFLANPAEYDGGELVVESPAGPTPVKLPAGSAFAYLSNVFHRVNPVTRGERLAAVAWVQSMVPDDRLRAILFDLAAIQQSLAQTMNHTPEFDLLCKVQQNLTRLAIRV